MFLLMVFLLRRLHSVPNAGKKFNYLRNGHVADVVPLPSVMQRDFAPRAQAVHFHELLRLDLRNFNRRDFEHGAFQTALRLLLGSPY
jgi:hypothetical protein